jgi:site-specific DNA-cytosine methylase
MALSHLASQARPNPNWTRNGVPSYGIAQRVSFPFAGIGNAERVWLEAMWPINHVNTIELRPAACAVLTKLYGGEKVVPRDITKVALADLQSCEGFVGAAPCTTFSLLGGGSGLESGTGQLFMKQLVMAAALANRGDRKLRWVVIENVEAILYKRASGCTIDVAQA